MKRWVYTVLIVIFSAVFLVSAVYIGNYFWQSYKEQSKYNELSALVNSARPTTPPTKPTPTTGATEGTSGTQAPPEDVPPETEPEPVDPYVEITDPKTGEPMRILREYAAVYQINPDMIGWIRIDDTKIDYPIVQKSDSVDYYLHRDYYKDYSVRGCLYVREVCDVVTPSDNVTIYGHCMKDGTMFGTLSSYRNRDFWEKHPTFTFDTLTEHHTYEIVSVFVTTATLGQGFPYHQFVNAANEEEFNEFVSTCKSLGVFDTGVSASYGDKLICLSTCEYTHANGRLVVMAKRIS